MKAMYDIDIDYLEVMEEGHKTVGHSVSDELTLFYTEKKQELVGFALEGASLNLAQLEAVPIRMRLTAIFRVVRGLLGLTQKEFANMLDAGERTLQRIEAGEANPTFDNLIAISEVAPENVNVSVLLAKQHRERSLQAHY